MNKIAACNLNKRSLSESRRIILGYKAEDITAGSDASLWSLGWNAGSPRCHLEYSSANWISLFKIYSCLKLCIQFLLFNENFLSMYGHDTKIINIKYGIKKIIYFLEDLKRKNPKTKMDFIIIRIMKYNFSCH